MAVEEVSELYRVSQMQCKRQTNVVTHPEVISPLKDCRGHSHSHDELMVCAQCVKPKRRGKTSVVQLSVLQQQTPAAEVPV